MNGRQAGSVLAASLVVQLPQAAIGEETGPVVAGVVGQIGTLVDEGESIAYVTDIQVRYRVQVCRCRSCGKAVRGQHPD